jgi:hypothetical protein
VKPVPENGRLYRSKKEKFLSSRLLSPVTPAGVTGDKRRLKDGALVRRFNTSYFNI